ncbi:PP2C family protein-serine/threonine phosphatase [Nocardia sputi]|uniref:PP2C family protein-serine/threonine phosphatase n=1 Tax=Nocardia sputi TaxID=2943705 RepID=UPI0020BE9D8F|nr:PP2C family protein-serine/threonine phosphatase [Nocardia sputi]
MSDDFAADRGREQQRSLFLALKGAELSLEQLWLRYFGLGGVAGYLDIDAYAHSTGELPPFERDILAQAANERLDELTWSKHATFSRPIRDGEAPNAALSALLQLLKGTDLAPPDQFGSTVFATAVLTELDLRSGRLRYINAGHPDPLLMREGKVVKPLHAGHCCPLGLGLGDLRVGEEVLQPADWLVLYTDGITEARDHTGEFFGEARLFDFLRREAAAGYPPPETARRLIKAVLSHQNGELQDDATVLLARWTQPRQLTP